MDARCGSLGPDQALGLMRAAMRSWPATESRFLDGWYLRRGTDATKRCNSVWPLDVGGQAALAERIATCEAFYADRGQPTIFQINEALSPPALDAALAATGYDAIDPSSVATLALSPAARLPEGIELEHRPCALVMNALLPADMAAPARLARAMLFNAIRKPKMFAIACQDGVPLAGGMIVVDGDWAGIANMYTQPTARRQGLAAAVLDALLGWAGRFGATRAYLQVEHGNRAAGRLYAARGFERVFDYHYRIKAI